MSELIKVIELGEDGDAYLVEGTDDYAIATERLAVYLDELGLDADDAVRGLSPVGGLDWWWETFEEGEDWLLRRHTPETPAPDDAVLFSAVRFS